MQKVVSRDGTVIAFDRIGAGPVLVLVGGAFQVRDDAKWVELARLLADRFTVVTYDRRGRGDSGDTAPYEVAREFEDLAAVIDAVGATAGVMGMSSGAVLALEAAAHGVPITALALYEPPFVLDDARPPLPADYLDRLHGALARGDRGGAVEVFMTAAVGIPAEYLAPMRADAATWDRLCSVAHTLPYDGAVMGDTMSGRPLSASRWASVRIPVLAVGGGASDPSLQAGARALAELLPTAGHATLEGQTHDVDPAALAPLLTTFFA